MIDITELQKAIFRENLEGWLFFNFRHRDGFADRFLDIPREAMNTRRWFYFVPYKGNPLAVVHAIEAGILDHLPGEKKIYSAAAELSGILESLACRCGSSYSSSQTSLSYLDYGTALTLIESGFTLEPAEGLIQRTMSLLSEEQQKAHETAAEVLYSIVDEIWVEIKTAFKNNRSLTEREVQERILEKIAEQGMITEHRPVVAAGKNTGNPHYSPAEDSSPLCKDELIQFDLWARLPGKTGIFADISQVGYLGRTPGEIEKELFRTVCAARDTAVDFIAEKMARGTPVRGCEVDEAARRILVESGKEGWIKHRTGHSIDSEIHGWGVNMDSIEFPDRRYLLEGSCFSIEPGIYSENIGCRTEINVYISGGKPVISGGPVQADLRTLD